MLKQRKRPNLGLNKAFVRYNAPIVLIPTLEEKNNNRTTLFAKWKGNLLNHLKRLELTRVTVIKILHYSITTLMILLFAGSLLMWLLTSNIWGLGGLFWSSWMTFAFVYFGTAFFLRIRNISAAESFVISLTSTISMIWLYEILYHFSFWDSWNYGIPPFFLLKENIIFLNYALISLSALSGYKQIKMTKWLSLVLIMGTILWIFWVAIGFPQYELPQQLFTFAWPIMPIKNPHTLAFPLYSLTKFLLGLAYVCLYLPSKQEFSLTMQGVKKFLTKRGFLPL